MLTTIVRKILGRSPAVRRLFWRGWYQFLARTYRQKFWSFMNYGYAPVDAGSTPLPLDGRDEPNRYSVQLYHYVAGAVDLKNRDVLEVGCGRGGGSVFLARHHAPRTMVGLDFSENAINFCRELHSFPNLTFLPGDAEHLPLKDGQFDAVINVESSHCYGSMTDFVREVRRVLRPGGHFLFADLRYRQELPDLVNHLTASGMEIIEREDITPNVVRALKLDHQRKERLIRQSVHRPLVGWFLEFAGVRNSSVYQRLHNRETVYSRFILHKN